MEIKDLLKPTEMIHKNHTIEKVWGEEHMIAAYDGMVGKIMVLKPKFSCSFHLHRIKRETFYVLDGEMLIYMVDTGSGQGEWRHVKPGDVIEVPIGKPHRFVGLTTCRFAEFAYCSDGSDGAFDNYRMDQSREWSDSEVMEVLDSLKE